MIDVYAIAKRYGGKVCKGNALIPTPGHSNRDRGTAIKASAMTPDGLLVACYNGSALDVAAVKEMLRRDGFLSGDSGRELTPAERLSLRKAELVRQRERNALEEAAAREAGGVWSNARPADKSHPYLVAKGLEPHGVHQSGDTLIIPMVDAGFRLWNVQRIRPDGFKLFLKDGRTKGLFWPQGAFLPHCRPSVGPLVIGEGFATMATIREATAFGVMAAMTARNLEAVARTSRKLFPRRLIIIAADDDGHLPVNIGMEAAQRAAEAINAQLATPLEERGSKASGVDFADLSRPEVATRIAAAIPGGASHE